MSKKNKIKTKTNKRDFSGFKFFFISVVFLIGILFYVWQKFEAVNIGYEIQALERDRDDLNAEVMQYVIERDRLMALDRIESVAKERLAMHVPKDTEIVILKA